MIEGIKITIPGSDVKALALSHAEQLRRKAAVMAQQRDTLAEIPVAADISNSLDAKRNLYDRAKQHRATASELEFIAKYLNEAETYLLDRVDLHKLGVCESQY